MHFTLIFNTFSKLCFCKPLLILFFNNDEGPVETPRAMQDRALRSKSYSLYVGEGNSCTN